MSEGSAENHGPLPALLVLLTIVTGFVDPVTYLKFGIVPALGTAAEIMAIVTLASYLLSRGNPVWVRA